MEFLKIRSERSAISHSKGDLSFLNSFDLFLKTEKNIMDNTVLLEIVSKMLGYLSLKNTQIYARLVDTKISNDTSQLQQKLNVVSCAVAV